MNCVLDLSRVTLAVHLNLPLYPNRAFPYDRAKRIAEEATLMDKYFDYGLSHKMYIEESRWVYTPMLEGFLSAAEDAQKSNGKFSFALCISGLLIEQMLKDDKNLISTINKLVSIGAVEMIATPFYNSTSSVHSSYSKDYAEQVKEHQSLVKKIFSADTKVLANAKLLYNDNVAKVAEEAGIKGIIVDDVPYLNVPSSSGIYAPTSSPQVRLLIRDLKSSLALLRGELSVHQLMQGAYHLIYVEGSSLPRANQTVYRNLAMSLVQAGVETALPSQVIEEEIHMGSLTVPEPLNLASSELDGDFSNLMKSPMQRLYHDRLYSLMPYVYEIDDPRIKGLWRMLQQIDFLLSMDQRRFQDSYNVFSSAEEAYSVLNTILVDFEGKVATLVQRIRKAKAQAAKAAQAQAMMMQQPQSQSQNPSPLTLQVKTQPK